MTLPTNYIIKGTCYKTIVNGRVEVLVTIGSGAGTTQDIYIVGNSGPSKSQILTCYNITQDETYQNPYEIETSSTSGKYLLHCSNFEDGWNVGDVILIVVSNYTATSRNKDDDDFIGRFGKRIGSRTRILTDEEGNEINHNNPLPVFVIDENLEFVNGDRSWTITRSDGQPDSETVVYKGKTYTRTFTYSGITLTARSKWTES